MWLWLPVNNQPFKFFMKWIYERTINLRRKVLISPQFTCHYLTFPSSAHHVTPKYSQYLSRPSRNYFLPNLSRFWLMTSLDGARCKELITPGTRNSQLQNDEIRRRPVWIGVVLRPERLSSASPAEKARKAETNDPNSSKRQDERRTSSHFTNT